MRSGALLALLLGAVCAGCEAADDLQLSTELVDFGAARPGATRQQQVRLSNVGKRRLHLGGTSSTNPAFTLLLPTETVLTPNESVRLTVQHAPPEGATEPLLARLVVWTDEGPRASLEASSLPTSPDCSLRDAVEFGPVQVGEVVTLELPLRNATALPAQAELGQVSGTLDAFVVEHGLRAIPAGGEVKVPITFHPRLTTEFAGALTLRPHLLCPTQRLSLVGTGVSRFLTTEPTALIWSTGLGLSEVQLVTLRNTTFTPVALFDVQAREGANPSQVFRALRFPLRIPPAVRDENGRLVPGEATLEVSFTPTEIGERMGLLSLSTELAAQPVLEVRLAGFGR